MKGKTTQERYDEICSLSGMSEDVVRRVLSAEKQSIVNSLKRGERATLIGRCVLRPEIKGRLGIGCEVTNYIKVSAEVASSLEASLDGMTDFDIETEDVEDNAEGIRLNQIPALV